MELQHHKFGYAGNDMNFAVFSDDPCRISYVESIAIPIGHTHVELYGIEPGARTKWIVVKQLDGHKATLKVFLRQNEKFLENEIDNLSQETRSQIVQRFPNLAAEDKPRWQVTNSARGAGRRVRNPVKEFRKPLARQSASRNQEIDENRTSRNHLSGYLAGKMYNIKVKNGYTTIIVKSGQDLQQRAKETRDKFVGKAKPASRCPALTPTSSSPAAVA